MSQTSCPHKEREQYLSTELLAEFKSLLGHDPDSLKFLVAYSDYCHSIDDLIDERITDPQKILRVFAQSGRLFASNFWHRYADRLFVVEALINNDYADSVAWERSQLGWQKNQSDVLRNSANNMLLAVIYLLVGYDAMRLVSKRLREHSHLKHHTPEGAAV